MRIRTTKKPLDLHLVADLALVEADHVTLVEDEQADVIEKGWIIAKRKVELLRRRDNDIALADRVLIEAANPDAAVECGDRLPKRAEGPLQRRFGLGGQRAQRRDKDHSLSAGQTAQDA